MAEPAKILLVDDDRVFVEVTKTVLESKYRVVTAYDGDEGLLKARKEKPDLILLDIIMPTRDGFDVCKQLKEDSNLAKIPVIMLTSFAQHRGETNIPVSAGFELEAEGYIDKPVSPDALLKQVGAMLKKK
ncbi:MAG: response regulator [Dehalococcoidales bacterium]|nr:response regulator [Dehalococcoidales bacterium]